jgi:imidazolonepropionase-like amidohydrolase
MHTLRFLPLLLGAATALSAQTSPAPAVVPNTPRVLRAARVLDGSGRILTRQDIVLQGGRITTIKPSIGPLPAGGIDLGDRTVLPGLIDTHVHLGW